jgi:glycosyltransferase involved in cell wall biosynthesis
MMSNSSKTRFFAVHYTNEIVERYSFFGQTVTFLMRNKIISQNESSSYTILNHPAFQFVEVPNFKSLRSILNKNIASSIIHDAVKNHDVIIVRLPSANGVIAKLIAEKLGKPVLVEVVACVFDALWNYDWRGKIISYFKYLKYKTLIRDSSHVIYVTNQFLQSRYPTTGISIGISDVELNTQDDNILVNRCAKIKRISPNVVLGTIASIDVPYKGQANVIKAIYNLKNQGKVNFIYKLVGQGNPNKLQKLINRLGLNDQIQIIGAIPHKEVFDFLDSIDIYIQPSKVEGMPRAVIEAMSRACPILASNIGGHPELLQSNSLYKADNISQLVNKLLSFKVSTLTEWAQFNYLKSFDFKSSILLKKRNDFYNDFLKKY